MFCDGALFFFASLDLCAGAASCFFDEGLEDGFAEEELLLLLALPEGLAALLLAGLDVDLDAALST